MSLTGGETSAASYGTAVSVSKTIYDSKGQVAETVDRAGAVMDYEYDSLGQKTAEIGPPLSAEDPGLAGYAAGVLVRLRTEYTYDSCAHCRNLCR